MAAKSCTIKALPPNLWAQAAARASGINPANAPSVALFRMAFPNAGLDPAQLALLTSKYWGVKGVHLTVGFLDNPAADLRRRILAHMNAWGKYCMVRFSETAVDPQVRVERAAGQPQGPNGDRDWKPMRPGQIKGNKE